jgi:hypothetical protein
MANYHAIDGSTPIVSGGEAGTIAGLVPLYFANIRFTAEHCAQATKQSQRSYLSALQKLA